MLTKISEKIIILLLGILIGCSHAPVKRDISSEPVTCANLVTNFFHGPVSPANSKQNFDNNLLAVHLTNFFPNESILRADSTERPRFAPTIHFSLGEPVISHGQGNWEKKKYAVILPVKYLKNQWMNIFAQDTFIMGDILLPKEAILLAPEGSEIPTAFAGRIIFYDPKEKITDVSKRIIREEKGVELKSTGSLVTDDLLLNGEKVVPEIIFKDYLNSQKNLTYKLHSATVVGIIDTNVYGILKNWYYKNTEYGYPERQLKYLRLLIKEALIQTDNDVIQMKLPVLAMNSYKKNRQALEGYLNLIDAEIELQSVHKKTFFKTESFLQKELLAGRNNPETIKNLLNEHLSELPDAPASQAKDLFMAFKKDSEWMDFETFKRVMYENRDLIKSSTQFFFEEGILTKALSMFKAEKLGREEVIKQFEKTVLSITEDFEYSNLSSFLYKVAPSERHHFIRNPKIKALIQANTGPKTFEALFK